MTARKPSPESTDWVKIINAIFAGAAIIMTIWLKYEQSDIKQTVVEVKRQTDGQKTASLKQIAIAAENLAESTKGKENGEQNAKAAKEAWDAYDTQAADMKRIHENTYP